MQTVMENVMETIFKKIDGMKDYVLELQRNMTRMPAISPYNGGKGEYEKAAYLEAELKKMKFDEVIRIEAPDPRAEKGVRPSLIAKYYGENKNKTLWLMAHTDIVPEGDRALWKTDPFELTLDKDGDTMYGRGAEDNQQAIATAFVAARALMENGKRPPVNLGLMLLADEEVGNEYGIDYLLKNHRDLFGKDDAFIVGDSGDPEGKTIEIAEKTVCWFKFTTHGKQAHGSRPALGNNAFIAGSALALALRKALYAKFDKKDELFNPSTCTFEPTKKDANVPNINTIPATDVFYMDSRILPSYSLKEVEAEIAKVAKAIEAEYKVKVVFEALHSASSIPTPADAELVKRYAEAVQKVDGVKAELIGIGGGTFAAPVRNLGLPAVVASHTYGTPHEANEKSSVKFILCDAKVVSYVLMNLK